MIYISSRDIDLNPRSLCVVSDFDQTMTAGDSASTLGVFNHYLAENYLVEKRKLLEEEASLNLDEEYNEKLHQLWLKKIDLLVEYLDSPAILEEIIAGQKIKIRPELKDFLFEMWSRNIPVIINSSGIKNLIEMVLLAHGCLYDNIVIFSNELVFSNKGVIFIREHTISPVTKSLHQPYLKMASNYDSYLLFGDIPEDIEMLPGDREVLSVGFLDNEIDDYLEKFKTTFDIVATHDTGFVEPLREYTRVRKVSFEI